MDLNDAPLIKQEFPNTEHQLLSLLSDADTNIKVKNEPILDEDHSIVTIKNEPLVEASFADNFIVKTENQLENHVTPLVDSFIIYELGTQQSNKQVHSNTQIAGPQYQLPTNTNVEANYIPFNLNERSPEIENQHLANFQYSHDSSAISTKQLLTNSNLIKNISLNPLQHQQSSQLSSAIKYNTTPKANNIAPAAPILLNTKLRKRNKNILPVSLLDKRTRYNIQGTIPKIAETKIQNAIEISSLKSATNTGSKKIINHIIKHKRVQRQYEMKLNETKCNSKDTVKNELYTMTPCDNTNIKLNPKDLIKPKAGDAQLKMSSPVKFAVINTKKIESTPIDYQTTDLNISSTTQTENISKKSDIIMPSGPPSNKIFLLRKDSRGSTTPEVRVKCLCRLTDDGSQTLDNSELTEFFKEMFEKTRRLTKKQQRNVKMSLLQAISDAEDAVDQGKCCF